VDSTAELWLYQRKTGAENKMDVFTSKVTQSRILKKRNDIPLYEVYYSGHVKIGAKTSIAIVLAIKPSVLTRLKRIRDS
jgi:hypothetical protein